MTKTTTPTKKRALLLGCPDERLKGVRRDLQTMKAILAPRGFFCHVVYRATRDQIVAGLESLAREAAPGDAVVVYYSGHGALVRRSSSGGAPDRPLQFLVPCDFDDTTEDDFRGVTDAQLSQLLRQITDRTDNVTLVLDCCHAARMARVPGTVKTVDGEFYKEVFGHIRAMLEDGRLDAGGAHVERNPRLVTVAASAQGESAYERPFEGEAQLGVLTEALERILGRAPDGEREMVREEVSWRSVMVRVRDRFKVTCPSQFPQIEGDDLRFTFSLSRAELDGALPLEITEGGRVVLHGGELHGIRKGDTYAVLPASEERNVSAREIAKATVERVGPVASHVSLNKDVAQISRQHGRSGGMKAFPKSRKMGKLPVAVRHWRSSVDVAGLIGASPFLYVTDERENAPFALVRQERSTVFLESREAGDVVLTGRWDLTKQNQTKGVEECVRKMEAMARSRHLFAVAKQAESKDIARHISVEVGTVAPGGEKQPSGPKGLLVKEGDKIYIEVRNDGRSTVYASIFDLCPDSVSLLSTASPSGRELMPGETYLYGERDIVFGDLEGSKMSWPDEMPRDSRRFFERIVVVVTSGRMDLRCLETQSGSSASRGDELDEEGLSELLSDIIFDTRRGGVVAQRNEPVQFGMRWASIELTQA
ncbi:peptidase c14 caspase catalytic subunit p20 [Colletotrichum plurivorum]|uniref:Peptidase c14 caspase catalytic subunit p20 n=1 Tax=Colletotrichum plurivorum TaxID=2175906 RepID=A0A8H6KTS2_9PEZI|nr:peptidase c14 caspase catalytic subunit p20 [Colletotrichum plurivorum]